ncbi:vWA domain-containing protein [Salirhabdus sp. Marseille-P4669]|uniref:vWA domain-containing protein n=1 Tax=Salirhabdus sp. Marseille-P4669 TaxID=2042310 RepID=UPI000C79C66B|nr:vWA domain-containing protein [Salirhabdus sp. Marseille-P4669]
MKQGVTEIIFLLDRSGSMAGLEQDTIGGFNALLDRQCDIPGEIKVTTVLFDNEYEVLWNGANAREVRLTDRDYYVRGTTALLDAIGKTIVDVQYRHSTSNESPEHVLFVITTDGMENASREFTYPKVQEMITKQQEKQGWEFIFLGANIDVAKEAENIGIHVERAYSFEATEDGVQHMYDMVSEELTSKRK